MTNDTFDWKIAARYWGEGKMVQYRIASNHSNIWSTMESDPAIFHSDRLYRLAPPKKKKLALAAFKISGCWKVSSNYYESLDDAKKTFNAVDEIIWPASPFIEVSE